MAEELQAFAPLPSAETTYYKHVGYSAQPTEDIGLGA